MSINHLEPSIIWGYFEDICKIPRLSRNEEKIRKFLIQFAGDNNIKAKEDNVGNILLTKEADPGFENRKSIVLQSHLDMVGEKNAKTDHDWYNDPILPLIENGWVTAKVTTLGADDGIGIAAQMAVLSDSNIKSGKIECLFTVDEETGMTGAIELAPGFFESNILINLDSEDEGELFIGCAGGIDTVASFKYITEEYSGSGTSYLLSVTGLHGGHSGDEIHNGYANSVKIIADLLTELDRTYDVRLSNIDAGNLRNAIPREAFANVYIEGSNTQEIVTSLSVLEEKYKRLYHDTEPGIDIKLEETAGSGEVLECSLQNNLLKSLHNCPHGVIGWSKTMENLVETSTNLASVKITDSIIKVVTSQRSSVEKAKIEIAGKIEAIFNIAGADVIHSDGYPGWEPNRDSEILAVSEKSYIDLFKTQPIVRAIHAGLECGLILEKYPDLDMISFGPTIKGAHTPEERIDINSTVKFWDLLLNIIDNIPDKQ